MRNEKKYNTILGPSFRMPRIEKKLFNNFFFFFSIKTNLSGKKRISFFLLRLKEILFPFLLKALGPKANWSLSSMCQRGGALSSCCCRFCCCFRCIIDLLLLLLLLLLLQLMLFLHHQSAAAAAFPAGAPATPLRSRCV